MPRSPNPASQPRRSLSEPPPTRTSTAVVPPSARRSGTRPTAAAPTGDGSDNLPLGWAEEEAAPREEGESPLALVGTRSVLMITVYIGDDDDG